MNKKSLAIILARKNSKRLKNKNVKLLNGIPLINWTISVAKRAGVFCDILISTDSKKIQLISKKQKVLCPWMRPKQLSSNKATSEVAALHALKWYEKKHGKVDILTLLQPTTPFRTIKNIRLGHKLFKKYQPYIVVSVSELKKKDHKIRSYIYKKPFCYKLTGYKKINKKKYFINGSLYVVNASQFKKKRYFSPNKFIPLLIKSKKESLDIDTNLDFIKATKILGRN